MAAMRRTSSQNQVVPPAVPPSVSNPPQSSEKKKAAAPSKQKKGKDVDQQQEFLQVLRAQIELNLASHSTDSAEALMTKQDHFDLSDYQNKRQFEKDLEKRTGLHVSQIIHNASPAVLYEEALQHEEGSFITNTGALAVSSGTKTGRCPKDKRIVDEP